MYNEPTLIDKVALVVGGSRGIGAAIVRRLAANGASVALTYANSAEKAAETARSAEAHGQPVIAIKADSADPRAVVDAVSQTIARFGHLDILVVKCRDLNTRDGGHVSSCRLRSNGGDERARCLRRDP